MATSRHRFHSQFCFVFVFLLASLFTGQVYSEELDEASEQPLIKRVVKILKQSSFTRKSFDDVTSKEFFDAFIEFLDSRKLFFTQQDVDLLREKYETNLDDSIKVGDTTPMYEIFELAETRMKERAAEAEELLKGEFDFTRDEYLTKYESFADTEEEIQDRLRKKLKASMLAKRIKAEVLSAEGEEVDSTETPKEAALAAIQGPGEILEDMIRDDKLELYLNALGSIFDPHTNYFSPNTLKSFMVRMSGELEGIGAELTKKGEYITVTKVMPNGPAGKDKRLKPQDKIVGVATDGNKENIVDVKGKRLSDVVDLIRGEKDTEVLLRVITAKDGTEKDYLIQRGTVQIEDSVAHGEILKMGKRPDGERFRLGIIDIPSFYFDMKAYREGDPNYRSVTRDVKDILNRFQSIGGGVDGVVIDLRGNGGGFLGEVISLVGLFVDTQPVVQVKGIDGKVEVHDDDDGGLVVYDGPLMVAINGGTASASEIFAAAIQDYKRGIVVGEESTHGKGSVQRMVELELTPAWDGSLIGIATRVMAKTPAGALKLTVQQYYRASGEGVQRRGVAADVVVPSAYERLWERERELPYALEFDTVPRAEGLRESNEVNEQLINYLHERSTERRQKSDNFVKLEEELAKFRIKKSEKKGVNLNEAKYTEALKEKPITQKESFFSDPEGRRGKRKFERKDFYNAELLAIFVDFLRSQEDPDPELAAVGE